MTAEHAAVFGTDPIIVAYGAGVDSTALLIGLRDRGVPVALMLFADTGSEKPETVSYLTVIGTLLARNRDAAGDGRQTQESAGRGHLLARRMPCASACCPRSPMGRALLFPEMESGPAVAFHPALFRLGPPCAALVAWPVRDQADRLRR